MTKKDFKDQRSKMLSCLCTSETPYELFPTHLKCIDEQFPLKAKFSSCVVIRATVSSH